MEKVTILGEKKQLKMEVCTKEKEKKKAIWHIKKLWGIREFEEYVKKIVVY